MFCPFPYMRAARSSLSDLVPPLVYEQLPVLGLCHLLTSLLRPRPYHLLMFIALFQIVARLKAPNYRTAQVGGFLRPRKARGHGQCLPLAFFSG